jgi:NADH:ubiquinone oxidoreductase subunit 2 (subunit N)
MMYMQEPGTEAPRVHVNAVSMTALAVSIAAIFYLGILPTQLLNLARQSIATIF